MEHEDARRTSIAAAHIALAWCSGISALFEATASRRYERVVDVDGSACCTFCDDDISATVDIVWPDRSANKCPAVVFLGRHIDVNSDLTVFLGREAIVGELFTTVVWALWPTLESG